MFKNITLGIALMLGLGADFAPAQFRYGAVGRGDRYDRRATEWIQLYLRRNPTPFEVLQIANQLRSGMSADEVQAGILSSNEYIRRSGGGLYAWANSMVADALGRQISPYERALVVDLVSRYGYYQAALITLQSRWAGPVVY